MFDGPLTVYDLELLPTPPDLVVLSACEAGRSDVHPGDGLMGTTAAMLSLGSQSVVSSVLPVRDESAARVMIALHERLARGEPPSAALTQVRSLLASPLGDATELAARTPGVLNALTACSFNCYGVHEPGRQASSLSRPQPSHQAAVQRSQLTVSITK
jgi:CHAT domain-containing protein